MKEASVLTPFPRAPDIVLVREVAPSLLAPIESLADRYLREAKHGLRTLRRPNSMNGHGLVLEGEDFEPLQHALLEALSPALRAGLLRLKREGFDGSPLTWGSIHAFMVSYSESEDRHLDLHVDDSDLTLNICLENAAEGAELLFEGRRCELHRQAPAAPEEVVVLAHQPGQAVLHAGDHRHRVRLLRAGRRRNLLFWLRTRGARPDGLVREARCYAGCGKSAPLGTAKS